MEQPLYTSVKVNNEIELCEIADLECKQLIEKALLGHRISYYIRWPKSSILIASFRRFQTFSDEWFSEVFG